MGNSKRHVTPTAKKIIEIKHPPKEEKNNKEKYLLVP
tara:strand:- start:261 stop:371 length:111 start_codon:yes stop_codon:yes gene_type:complete